jgi:LysM repeat protein
MKMSFHIPKLGSRKRDRKLRATAMRRSVRATAADYEELSEPNMKLSRALLIVLLLHVVAVSGIIAFNAIKARQASSSPTYVGVASAASPRASASVSTEHIKRALPLEDATHESHRTYIVAKGDNPVTIARKLKVSYDELIALNHIDDPRKLRVGQKLLIPSKTVKGKKTGE